MASAEQSSREEHAVVRALLAALAALPACGELLYPHRDGGFGLRFLVVSAPIWEIRVVGHRCNLDRPLGA